MIVANDMNHKLFENKTKTTNIITSWFGRHINLILILKNKILFSNLVYPSWLACQTRWNVLSVQAHGNLGPHFFYNPHNRKQLV